MKNAKEILKKVFGYDKFRGQQEEVIASLMAGHNVLALMPTGAGKSLCYQIPAILLDGTAIVVSPLIALMQDQVQAAKSAGVCAEFLNSTLSSKEQSQVLSKLESGQIDLLYVAPERLLMPQFLELVLKISISFFAIDEAHCLSQWGHDFRPEYRKLKIITEKFSQTPIIALTATADQLTREDIIATLNLRNAKKYISSFDRPNICYRIYEKDNAKNQLLKFIQDEHAGDAGIVYCSSRKKVEDAQEFLSKNNIDALCYHAGLSKQVREKNQNEFINEEGRVMVATIAFGMGINKPNVRFVAHLNLPSSIEAYYQETGRAGRDGLPANAWMAYGLEDVILHKQMVAKNLAEQDIKNIETRKIDSMLGLCESIECRRKILLGYFQEELIKPCQNCDNCLSPCEKYDASIEAQKALSCILRTREIFGANHLIDVLRGKENDKVKKFSHQNLSVFGLGKEQSATHWRSLFRQLIAKNMIAIDHEGYGAFKFKAAAIPVLKGKESLFVKPAQKKKNKTVSGKKTSSIINSDDQKLLDQLKQERTKIAKELGQAPYLIFHDKSLVHMAQEKPKDLQSFKNILGVGEHKCEKFAKQFLQVICEHA